MKPRSKIWIVIAGIVTALLILFSFYVESQEQLGFTQFEKTDDQFQRILSAPTKLLNPSTKKAKL